MNQAKLWIDHTISVLPDGVEDEIRILITDLPRDRVGALLDEIVRASRTAMAGQAADLPGEVVIMVDPVAEKTEEKDVAPETIEPATETQEMTREEAVVPGPRVSAERSRDGGRKTSPVVRREWTPEEDIVLRRADTPAAACEIYRDIYPLIDRTYSSIKSRWYRVKRWSEEGGGAGPSSLVTPLDLGLRIGTRVRIIGDREFSGETGVVKRINAEANEMLIAVDGVPDYVWIPIYAVAVVDGGDGS